MTTIMKTIHSINDWRMLRQQLPVQKSIGFVPTMGNLHAGHASLLKQSRDENDFCVLSIFVNPTQFNDKNDLKHYPRTLEADLALAHSLNIDYVLVPDNNALYPDNYHYKVTEHCVSNKLEGAHRPGHFDGVLTIVMKLFSLVKPHRAYFGEKDYQQLYLVKEMVKAFFLDIEIIACPTLRRHSGLPLSSRNHLMTPTELALADEASKLIHANDELEKLRDKLAQKSITIDYLEKWQGRLLSAIRIGAIRILDNRKFN